MFSQSTGNVQLQYNKPLQVKFVRYAGSSCAFTASFEAKPFSWIDGPNFFNGICQVTYTAYNGQSSAQELIILRTIAGKIIKTSIGLFVAVLGYLML